VTGSTHAVMLAAFSGWNDAAEAASGAVDHLWAAWRAQTIAEIDPDDFTDFTVSRPEVRVEAGVAGDLRWPRTELGWCTPDRSLSVVMVRGPEPQFRWGSFCEALVDAADELGCSTVVTLGAMLSEVPHTRPVPVFTAAHDPEVADALGLPTSDYVGPTGIPSALAQAAHRRGLESLGLWAALPGYAAGVPSPVGTLALVEQAAAVLGVGVEAPELDDAAGEYVEHLDSLVAEDEETSAYLDRLEHAYDEDAVALGSADDLVSEVESFLRDQS
jgi:hypothetical protein